MLYSQQQHHIVMKVNILQLIILIEHCRKNTPAELGIPQQTHQDPACHILQDQRKINMVCL